MTECTRHTQCEFFNNQNFNSDMASIRMKETYCTGDFKSCARFMINTHISNIGIPFDLLPNQRTRAAQLISNLK
ncbi:hypothetical protein KAR48_00140 [bacterium]|nr:hypothetical protein [bacterium]